jgi:hypothetical protein
MQNNNSSSEYVNRDSDTESYNDLRKERRRWRVECRAARCRLPFHGMLGGSILLLLGILLLLNQAGSLSGDTWWQTLLIGMGGLFIINGLICYRLPILRFSSYGKFVAGTVLILIGTLSILGFSQWWPIVLIVIGVAMLLRFLWYK